MRKIILATLIGFAIGAAAFMIVNRSGLGQPEVVGAAAGAEGASKPAPSKLEDMFVQFPVLPGNEKYSVIDGKHLHTYVVDQVNIARRYRDQGHQFWGRVIGSSADTESAQWLLEKFRQIGLSDVRLQPLDLVPQWFPQSWEVVASSGDKSVKLETVQPTYYTAATPAGGLDLEAAYVGLGTEADYAARKDSVRGKAVFIYGMPRPGGSPPGALARAEANGAAVIFEVNTLPGNKRSQEQIVGTKVPTFTVGQADGNAVRDLIGKAPAGKAPRIKVRLDTRMVPDLKSATVWGTLPGATDETIFVLAHRDGWFDGATDNASGVAAMVGLAEYFAKVPQAQRRRTMYFLGVNGHHNKLDMDPNVRKEMLGVIDERLADTEAFGSRSWLVAHRAELFTKTALMINSEHPSTLQTYLNGDEIRNANTYTALQWFAGGPSRPKLRDLTVNTFREFGVTMYETAEAPAPPGGELGMFWRFLPGITSSDYNMYFHTDAETPETVPWTGLEAATRAYAKIVDEVNKLELADLQRPHEVPPSSSGTR